MTLEIAELPIAVEVAVTVVEAVAVIAVTGDAEHAIDRPNGAADTGSNRAAYDSAYRAGRAAALSRTLLSAADDALGVSDRRDRSQGKGKRRGR